MITLALEVQDHVAPLVVEVVWISLMENGITLFIQMTLR